MLSSYLANTLGYSFVEHRSAKNHKGLIGFLQLWWFAFKHAKGAVNVTVQRLCLPVLLASILTNKKVIVVFHHYDKREKSSFLYHLNFRLMLVLLKAGCGRLKVVVVAKYWQSYLVQNGVAFDDVFLVPNLFDTKIYAQAKVHVKKNKQIYFGQYSAKQHPDVFEVIEQLALNGYECFFTTLHQHEEKVMPSFRVKKLSYDAYLQQLATSLYTVCLSGINEGWNRTAHESLLLGTPVIGNNAGGLGELLQLANQPIINSVSEATEIILQNKHINIPEIIFEPFDLRQISYYAKSIVAFCNNGIS